MLRVRRPCVRVLVPLVRGEGGALWLDYDGARSAAEAKDIDIPYSHECYAGTVAFVIFWVSGRPDAYGVEAVIDAYGCPTELAFGTVWLAVVDADPDALRRAGLETWTRSVGGWDAARGLSGGDCCG